MGSARPGALSAAVDEILDLGYLRRIAELHCVDELLRRACREADLSLEPD